MKKILIDFTREDNVDVLESLYQDYTIVIKKSNATIMKTNIELFTKMMKDFIAESKKKGK